MARSRSVNTDQIPAPTTGPLVTSSRRSSNAGLEPSNVPTRPSSPLTAAHAQQERAPAVAHKRDYALGGLRGAQPMRATARLHHPGPRSTAPNSTNPGIVPRSGQLSPDPPTRTSKRRLPEKRAAQDVHRPLCTCVRLDRRSLQRPTSRNPTNEVPRMSREHRSARLTSTRLGHRLSTSQHKRSRCKTSNLPALG